MPRIDVDKQTAIKLATKRTWITVPDLVRLALRIAQDVENRCGISGGAKRLPGTFSSAWARPIPRQKPPTVLSPLQPTRDPLGRFRATGPPVHRLSLRCCDRRRRISRTRERRRCDAHQVDETTMKLPELEIEQKSVQGSVCGNSFLNGLSYYRPSAALHPLLCPDPSEALHHEKHKHGESA